MGCFLNVRVGCSWNMNGMGEIDQVWCIVRIVGDYGCMCRCWLLLMYSGFIVLCRGQGRWCSILMCLLIGSSDSVLVIICGELSDSEWVNIMGLCCSSWLCRVVILCLLIMWCMVMQRILQDMGVIFRQVVFGGFCYLGRQGLVGRCQEQVISGYLGCGVFGRVGVYLCFYEGRVLVRVVLVSGVIVCF